MQGHAVAASLSVGRLVSAVGPSLRACIPSTASRMTGRSGPATTATALLSPTSSASRILPKPVTLTFVRDHPVYVAPSLPQSSYHRDPLDFCPALRTDDIKKGLCDYPFSEDYAGKEHQIKVASDPNLPGPSKPIRVDIFNAYLTLRTRDPRRQFLSELPLHAWKYLVKWANIKGLGKVKDLLLQDLVHAATRDGGKEYARLLLDMFDHQIELSDRQALDLYHAIPPEFSYPDHLTPAPATRVAEAMLNDNHFSIHIPFLIASYPYLIPPEPRYGQTLHPPTGFPARQLEIFLRVMERLSLPSSQEVSGTTGILVDMLCALGTSNCVPKPAMELAMETASQLLSDSAPKERDWEILRLATLQASLRTVFKWGWHHVGLKLLDSTLPGSFQYFRRLRAYPKRLAGSDVPWKPPPAQSATMPEVARLVLLIVEDLLAFPSSTDRDAAAALIVAYITSFHPCTDLPRLPNHVLETYLHYPADQLDRKKVQLVYSVLSKHPEGRSMLEASRQM